jgi:hypothetical protein
MNDNSKVTEANQEFLDELGRLAEVADSLKRSDHVDNPLWLLGCLTSVMGKVSDSALRLNNILLDDAARQEQVKAGPTLEPYAIIIGDPFDYLFSESGELLMESNTGENLWCPTSGELKSTISATIGNSIVLTGCKDIQGFAANLWTLVMPTSVARYRSLKEIMDELYTLGFLGDHINLGFDNKVFEVTILNPTP